MNNLMKILTSLLLVISLNADQGMLDRLILETTTNSGITNDLQVVGTDIYGVTSSSFIKFNSVDMSFTSNALSSITNKNKKIIANASDVFVLEDNYIITYNTDTTITAEKNSLNSSKFFNSFSIAEDDNYMYIATTTGILVVDISNTASMSEVAFLDTANARDLIVKGNYLYVADDFGLSVINIVNPITPFKESSVAGEFTKIAFENNNLFVLGYINNVRGLVSFDISSPSAPNYISVIALGISETTSLHIADSHAYVSTGIYDVSNKSNMLERVPYVDDSVSSTASNGDKIYQSLPTSSSVTYSIANSDYDDDIVGAETRTAKTIAELGLDNGVFGNLSDITDIDFIKITLANGKFNATVSGLSDLNVSLYDTADVNATPIALESIDSSTNTLKISVEVGSGTYYLKLQSTANDNAKVGDYKIVNDYAPDDWSDTITSAALISTSNTINGNINKGSDQDHFRIDLTSKGVLSIKSSNGDVIDAEIKNSYDATRISGTGDFAESKDFNIPSAGTYFIDIIALSSDVVDADYSFKVTFSKSALLDYEDDSIFALKQVGAHNDSNTSMQYGQIKSDGENIYVYEGSTNILNLKDENFNYISVYPIGVSSLVDYEIVADNVYVLTNNGLIILRKDLSPRSSVSTISTTNTKVVVNGDFAYTISESSSMIEIFDISQKDAIASLGTFSVAQNINDIALRGYFIDVDGVEDLKPYLYLATDAGLYIYDFNDISDLPASIPTPIVYKPEEQFYNIVISAPDAYLVGNSGFEILSIKRATSTPKFRGSVGGVSGVKDIVINEDFAYIVNDDSFLQIIDIENITSPKIVDFGLLRAESIFVDDGLGYVVGKTNITDLTYERLSKYDMSKDYADVKGESTPLNYETVNYGVISKYRPTEIDVFYIDAQNYTTLTFTTNGEVNASYNIHELNSDALKYSFNVVASEEENLVELAAGEYYLKVSASSSGTYNFIVDKVEDDLKDNFADATTIMIATNYDANISTLDTDIVKIVVSERGTFTFTSDVNIATQLYYSDTSTLIADDSTLSSGVVLSEGTYYIKMNSKNSYSGEYSFNSTFISNGELSMPNGFDDIRNFNAVHTVIGDRYIYVLTKDNTVAIYNHLLQKVEEGEVSSYSGNVSFETCGKVLYNDLDIYINKKEYDETLGLYTCGHGYFRISMSDKDDEQFGTELTGELSYDNMGFSEFVYDISIVGASNGYFYQYSDSNNSIYKTRSNHGDEYGSSIKPYGKFSVDAVADINSIRFIENDGDIDFIVVDNVLNAYKSNPETELYSIRDVYDANGFVIGTESYVSSIEPTIIDQYTFNIDVEDIYINRGSKKLYVLVKNSTLVKTIDYSSATLSSSVVTDSDIGSTANGMYVRGDEIYFSFSTFGIRIYDFPLSEIPTPKKSIENIGPNISNPFSYDGTTFNYLSDSNLQVGYLSDSFVDGVTSGTYSVVSDLKEGEGGYEGCFIATAAYGNYFESNVKVLRDFRDDYLLQNELGRLFVDTYYRHSPSIASDISKSEFAKSIVRVTLTPIVYIIKYPLEMLFLFSLMLFPFIFKRNMSKRKIALLLSSFVLVFGGCEDKSESSSLDAASRVAVLAPFITNIDESQTNKVSSLGFVDISSGGGSNISSFILEGSGYKNFNIATNGEITTKPTTVLDCNSSSRYDLEARARNSAGDSEPVEAVIQVNCMDEPVLSPFTISVNSYESSGDRGSISILRNGLLGDTNVSIVKIELTGDGSENLSVSNDGSISLTSSFGNSKSKYRILARAINDQDKTGPYVVLTVNINGTIDGSYDSVNTDGDDYPNDMYQVSYTSTNLNIGSGANSIYGTMNYEYDHDYFRIYVPETQDINFELFADSGYSYNLFDNYIAVYNSNFEYLMTFSGYGNMTLDVGEYYINVHHASDYYYLQLTYLSSGSGEVENFDRFSRNFDTEIVYDNNYNLSWQDDYWAQNTSKQWLTQANYDTCVLDNASPACFDTSGDTAETYCTDLVLGAYDDWRLPTDIELTNILEYSNYPKIDATFQNRLDGGYWSNTTTNIYSEFAVYVDFSNTNVVNDTKNIPNLVSCVRDGQY